MAGSLQLTPSGQEIRTSAPPVCCPLRFCPVTGVWRGRLGAVCCVLTCMLREATVPTGRDSCVHFSRLSGAQETLWTDTKRHQEVPQENVEKPTVTTSIGLVWGLLGVFKTSCGWNKFP